MNILPVNTIVLDLSATEDEILARMKLKTRYNIRLALKHGVEVRSVGKEGLEVWYSLYQETAFRNGLHLIFCGKRNEHAGILLISG